MRKNRKKLFDQGPPLMTSVHPLFGSGHGFAADIMSESGFQTLPEASGTELEREDPTFGAARFERPLIQPPWGLSGMMPPASMETGPTQPGITEEEEGIGGAGSFLCGPSIGAKG